jgi:hypothetical protein
MTLVLQQSQWGSQLAADTVRMHAVLIKALQLLELQTVCATSMLLTLAHLHAAAFRKACALDFSNYMKPATH